MNKPKLSQKSIPVESLRKGQSGLVTEMRGDIDEVARLAEMGIRTGVQLSCLQRGCPCIVQCGHTRMCLRTAGNLQVMVSRI